MLPSVSIDCPVETGAVHTQLCHNYEIQAIPSPMGILHGTSRKSQRCEEKLSPMLWGDELRAEYPSMDTLTLDVPRLVLVVPREEVIEHT